MYWLAAARSKTRGWPASISWWSPNHRATASGSKGTPARPAAATMRPQLGSRPWMAHFTSDEPQTVRAMARAAASSAAPSTRTAIKQVAPSPSRAMARARCCDTAVRPASRASKCSGARGSPAAKARKVSLVLVSPSTVIALKERSTARRTICCHSSAGTPASQLR